MPVENASSHHIHSDPTINVSLGHDIVTKEIELEITKIHQKYLCHYVFKS